MSKPYTIQSYKEGKEAITRCGYPIKNLKSEGISAQWPLSGEPQNAPLKYKNSQVWQSDGKWSYDGQEHELDLFEV